MPLQVKGCSRQTFAFQIVLIHSPWGFLHVIMHALLLQSVDVLALLRLLLSS